MEPPGSPQPPLIAIIGHTAGGKTALAARIARILDGEVISADSRQVYRGMDIGTGKDLSDYLIDGIAVPFHLIDVAEAGERYTLYDYQRDFNRVFSDIRSRGKRPVLCGGTGLYAEAVIRGYNLAEAPADPEFRTWAEHRSEEELTALLASLIPLHNQTDTETRERLLRAIEVAKANQSAFGDIRNESSIPSKVFGVRYETENRRSRITARLKQRLDEGLVAEVQTLLLRVSAVDLMYYGLEYKYVTQYCTGMITFDRMFSELNTAIHQFAKRQMTWFRGMERRGVEITWIPGELPFGDKVGIILEAVGSPIKSSD